VWRCEAWAEGERGGRAREVDTSIGQEVDAGDAHAAHARTAALDETSPRLLVSIDVAEAFCCTNARARGTPFEVSGACDCGE
jgi:hypothetical protein